MALLTAERSHARECWEFRLSVGGTPLSQSVESSDTDLEIWNFWEDVEELVRETFNRWIGVQRGHLSGTTNQDLGTAAAGALQSFGIHAGNGPWELSAF